MFLKVAVGILGVLLGVFSAFAMAAFQAGFAMVEIHSSERNVSIPVPLLLADIAFKMAPGEEIARLGKELRPHRALILKTLEELEGCEDVDLVEVESKAETVRVRKNGSNLLVHVEEADETVRVELPLQGLRRIVSVLLQSGMRYAD